MAHCFGLLGFLGRSQSLTISFSGMSEVYDTDTVAVLGIQEPTIGNSRGPCMYNPADIPTCLTQQPWSRP